MPTITPDPSGFITRQQAAELCGVEPDTISQWIRRGHLKVAWRYKGRMMLDPVAVAKADHATKDKARRVVVRSAA
jgi:predicted site-specific integrase-resolvase